MATIIDSLIVTLGLDTKDIDAKAAPVRNKLSDLEKAGTKTESGLKGIGKASKETSSELSALTGKLGSFLAILGSTAAVSAFVKDTVETNTQLYFLSRNLDMSTQKIFAWGAAAQEIGGNKGTLQNFMRNIAAMPGELLVGKMPQLLPLFARLGISFREPFDQIMVDMSKRFAGMDRKVAFSFGMASGIPEDVMNLLLQGPGAVQAAIGRTQGFAPTGKEAQSAVELKRRFTDLELLLVKIGYDLLYKITPYLKMFLDTLQNIGKWAQQNDKIVTVIAGIVVALSGVVSLAGGIGAVTFAWTALMGAITSASGPVLAVLAVVTALAGGIALLWDDYKAWSSSGNSLFDWTEFEKNVRKSADAFDWLGDKIGKATDAFGKWIEKHGIKIPDGAAGKAAEWFWNHMTFPGLLGIKVDSSDQRALNSKGKLSGTDIQGYFIGRGYSKEYAAAMAASAMAESGGDPNVTPGDQGTSFGLFQIHDPALKNLFQKMYGHDISKANAAEQLDFAFNAVKSLGINTSESVGPRYAAEMITKKFERPKDISGESERRGSYASNLLHGTAGASSLPAGVSSNAHSVSHSEDNSSVTHIGTINLQNPASGTTVTPSMARGMDWNTLLTQQNFGLMP